MPMRMIEERFTRSELALMGWRSRETAYNMRSTQSRPRPAQAEENRAIRALEARMGTVANKAETENGDIDLGRLTGKEALHYFGALGIRPGRA